MAFTSDQLNLLDEAIAEGALTVKYSDKEVTYRSLDEMLRIRALMAESLGLSAPNGGRRYAQYSSGLNHCGNG